MKKSIFIFLVCLIIPMAAYSAVPTDEVKNKVNTIAGGEIVEILCHRKMEEMKNGKKVGTINMLKAKLKVTSFDKGNMKTSLTLLFDDKATEGSAKHYVGDKGKYYLSCMGDFCSLAGKESVEYSSRGEKKLPSCK